MAIVLDATSLSDIASYDGLTVALQTWLDRNGDDDIDALLPYFIRLAESRFNRVILSPEREAVATLTASVSTALPTDLHAIRNVYLDTDPRRALEQVSPSVWATQWASQATGMPQVYTVKAGNLAFGPAPDSAYSVILDYYQKIPNLTQAQQTNWLLVDHPDLYLFASLLQAEFQGWNDDRLPLIKSAVDEMIAEINIAGGRKRYGAAPLRMRSGINERL